MAYTTINKPSDYFNTVTYTGDGSASRNITGVGFQPDWVWGKCRNTAVSHALYDAVRGASNLLNSNTTSAEGTNAALNAFISDGFTVNSDSYLNGNSNTYVAWNWLASNTTASNTDGTITSTVSANQTAGFSIGTYNGTSADNTVGHGLGVAPDMIIVKCKSTAHDWVVYHQSMGNGKAIALNLTNAEYSATGWQNTDPTSTVFSIDNTANSLNQSGQSFVFYAFASKKGYSKFGSYTGNGNADGTFVYTGFKPAFVLRKRTDTLGSYWNINDNKRDTNNVMDKWLFPQASDAESTGANHNTDFLSNGFKCRGISGAVNASGGNYIYMAFAEAPLVGTNGVTAKAR